jgi:hypothetical protein
MDKTLIGYYRSLDQVPSPVAAVLWNNSSKLFFIAFTLTDYSGSDVKEISDPNHNSEFTRIDSQEIIKDFDYRKHALYLVAENTIKCYEIRKADIFFRELLEDSSFSKDNPFLRLSIAQSLHDFALIFEELNGCDYYVQGKGNAARGVWLRNYIEELNNLQMCLDESSKLYFKVTKVKLEAEAEATMLTHEIRGVREKNVPSSSSSVPDIVSVNVEKLQEALDSISHKIDLVKKSLASTSRESRPDVIHDLKELKTHRREISNRLDDLKKLSGGVSPASRGAMKQGLPKLNHVWREVRKELKDIYASMLASQTDTSQVLELKRLREEDEKDDREIELSFRELLVGGR